MMAEYMLKAITEGQVLHYPIQKISLKKIILERQLEQYGKTVNNIEIDFFVG
jgi:hypothetical protein